MKIDTRKTYAVLTGDIVGSSQLTEKQRTLLLKTLNAITDKARLIFSESIPLDVDIFRGDSWQLLISKPNLALRIAIFFRAMLKSRFTGQKIDTRISISVDTIISLPGTRVSQGDGPAFRISGRGLEKMPQSRLIILASDADNFRVLDTMIYLMDEISRGWTSKQALAVTGALQNLKQKEIGKLWKKTLTQSGVARHLEKASWDAIEAGILCFESEIHK